MNTMPPAFANPLEKSAPPKGTLLSNFEAMRLALDEAAKGFAHASPNPRVGCVILDPTGRLLSTGCHERAGTGHAEVNAVRKLNEDELRGAQVFVTLEPCAHEGRTGSCAKMLAGLPQRVGRVIYGLEDPNPLVSGKGARILRDAGIPCDRFGDVTGSEFFARDLEEVCEAFLWNYRQQSVFVTLKIATSLDGKVALETGESKWITGEESRAHVQLLRAGHDAILVGSGTVEADDPRLDVRLPGTEKVLKAVILDRQNRLKDRRAEFQLSKLRAPEDVIWIDEPLEPAQILERLFARGIRSVFIEGGARVASAFLEAGLINRLHLFEAPVLMGGKAWSWTDTLPISTMKVRLRPEAVRTQTFGRDLYLTGLLRDPLSGVSYRGM